MRLSTFTIMAVVLAGISPTHAADDKEDAIKKELKSLEGTWQCVAGINDGRDIFVPSVKITATIKDNTLTSRADGRVVDQGQFRIDPTAKPKQFDSLLAQGEGKGKVNYMAIYQLNGDELIICYQMTCPDRPTDFTAKAGSGRGLSTWKRVKP